jgi:hypothetical protein
MVAVFAVGGVVTGIDAGAGADMTGRNKAMVQSHHDNTPYVLAHRQKAVWIGYTYVA